MKYLILSIVQGVTEFLPISSSGHLVLFGSFLGQKQDLCTVVMMHLGTLLAICVYFFKDIVSIIIGFFHLLLRRYTEHAKLTTYILIASIPTLIVGFIIRNHRHSFESTTLIALNMMIFGALMGLADKAGASHLSLHQMNVSQALWVGIGQAVSLFPAVSRSGACLTMLRIMGFHRQEAIRFTFLLAIPAISGASFLTGVEAFQRGELTFGKDTLFLIGMPFCFGLMALYFISRYLRYGSLMPFAVYRIVVGAVIYALMYVPNIKLPLLTSF